MKFESSRVSSLKAGARVWSLKVRLGIELGSLKPRQRVARGSKVKGRWRTRRGSQSSPQARVRKFESLEFESLKPREFESSKIRKVRKFEKFQI